MDSRKWKRQLARVSPSTVGLIVAAVLVGVGSVALVVREPVAPESGSSSTSPQAEIRNVSERPVIAFLGDSYTAGSGTESTTPSEAAFEGYAGQTAADLDAVAKVYGQGGTGFLNPGQPEEHETTYLPRARKIKGDPAVIVVQGGINDVVMPGYAATIGPAASEVLTTLARVHPDARLVVLGPVLAPEGPTETELAPVVTGLRAAADDAGAVFVDAREWLPKRSLYIDDMVHPNPEGHAIMARLLAKRIEPLLRRS